MDFLKKLLKPKPWAELQKDFELKMSCEECGFETNQLFEIDTIGLYCKECAEAHDRRTRFEETEEEFKNE